MRFLIVLALALSAGPAVAEDISRCVLEVGGKSYIDAPCDFSALNDGGDFQIGSDQYFAYVYPSSAPVIGYWNGSPDASHAHDPLGELQQDGACWVNDTTKVCAYR